MKLKAYEKKAYERPVTELTCVEVEGSFASSVTEYENAGSAGEGEYHGNAFEEFGSNPAGTSATSTDSFDSWGTY